MLSDALAPPPAAPAGRAPHVVVLGGGVCGLYAARHLVDAGVAVTVLERREVPGGLAAGRERNGNYYDFGVHQLHGFDPAILDDMRAIMGERLIPVEKHALIRFGGGFRRYPLEFFDLITGVPPWTLVRALLGLAVQQVHNRRGVAPSETAEDALVQLYGRPLYEYFFRDFTHRYWGIPPTELSAAFVRSRMPRLSAVDVVKKALGLLGARDEGADTVESALAKEVLWYSRTGARELPMALVDYVQARGGRVLLESPVVGIDVVPVTGGAGAGPWSATAVRYRQGGHEVGLPCDAVLATIPLPDLVAAFGPVAPPAVQAAARSLGHKAVAIYGFLVRKPRVLDAMYVYYRERVFHRLAEPAQSGVVVNPPGHTVVLAETTCDEGDAKWRGDPAVRQRILADMAAEGLLTEADVVETHVFADEHAYPVFALGFEPHLAAVQAFLGTVRNLRSTGRQGAFCYPNMHSAMRMGADAAAALLAEMAPDAVGAP
jgi:protoporphyrinogen oxidase